MFQQSQKWKQTLWVWVIFNTQLIRFYAIKIYYYHFILLSVLLLLVTNQIIIFASFRPVVLYQSLQSRGSSRGSSIAVLIVGYLTWGSWILLLILNSILPGLYAIAWFCYLSFVSILAAIRYNITWVLWLSSSSASSIYNYTFLTLP